MIELICLLLILLLGTAVLHTPQLLGDPAMDRLLPVVMVGLLMLGAWLVGRLFARWKLPRISGYLLFGIFIGPFVPWGWIPGEPATDAGVPLSLTRMQFVKDLAISLIALTAGGEIIWPWLRGQLGRLIVMTVLLVIGVALISGAGLTGLLLAVPGLGPSVGSWSMLIVMVGFLALIGSGNSPSMTIALISECRADGPMARMTMAVTVCKDLLIVISFALWLSLGHALLTPGRVLDGWFLVSVAFELAGSILVGAILGGIMGYLARGIDRHLTILIVGFCFLMALLGEQQWQIRAFRVHFEVLLMALSAGVTIRNLMPRRGPHIFHEIEQMSLPIYCLFFAVVGAGLDVRVLGQWWPIIGLLVVGRLGVVWLVCRLGGWAMGLHRDWRHWFYMGMLPQAGVTLALMTLMSEDMASVDGVVPEWCQWVADVLLGMVVVHALLGPMAFRWALVRTGEAGRADDRPDSQRTGNAEIHDDKFTAATGG